ncbi:Uncharacterised protein [Segatella copri]|nr:Uncharacterised protein [Segatella copri]
MFLLGIKKNHFSMMQFDRDNLFLFHINWKFSLTRNYTSIELHRI